MDCKQFAEDMKCKMEELLPSNTKCEVITENKNVYLLLYYNQNQYYFDMRVLYRAYQNGSSTRCLLLSMIKKIKQVEMRGEYEDIIGVKLVNYNKYKQQLQHIKHEKYLDLAIVYYYIWEDREITDGEEVNINLEDALEKTIHYLGVSLNSLEDIIFSVLCEEEDDKTLEEVVTDIIYHLDTTKPMYVLTNKRKYLGAIAILYPKICQALANRMGRNLFILPSSIHEVILIPDNNTIRKEELESMVSEINRTEVLPKDYLSDSIYYYDREKESILLLDK